LLLLNNWTHVKADQFIVGRVSSETKARLRALAEKELLSESALLRRLVELVLLKAGLSPSVSEDRGVAGNLLREFPLTFIHV